MTATSVGALLVHSLELQSFAIAFCADNILRMIGFAERFRSRRDCPQCSARMTERSKKWIFPWTNWGCTQCGAQLQENLISSIVFGIVQAGGVIFFNVFFPRLVLPENFTNVQAILCMLPGITWLLVLIWLYPSIVTP